MHCNLTKQFEGSNRIIQKYGRLTVYRLDFKAVIKTETGESKVVIIEVQKAKTIQDIMRFRYYLGKQYMDENLSYKKINKGTKIKKLAGFPIISIYFLGERLEEIQGVPVIRINRQVIDRYTKQVLNVKDDFIESLTHDCILVSISDLRQKRRDELEQLLSIFDQSNRYNSEHILNVKEDDFPSQYTEV